MALYRAIQTSFWNDSWVVELTPEQKFFFIYIFTNPSVKQCGIYEISLRQMEFETGYNKDTILKLLNIFEAQRKIKYSLKTSEICIINFSKYNFNTSPQVKIHIQRGFKEVKDKSLISYLYGIDTIYEGYIDPLDTPDRRSIHPHDTKSSIKRKRKEEEKEKNQNYEDFLISFNTKLERDFKKDNKSESQFYERIKEGYSLSQITLAFENAMTEEYHKSNNYNHLTPEFITRADKLAKYINYKPGKRTLKSENLKLPMKKYENIEEALKDWSKLIEVTTSIDQAIKNNGGYQDYGQKNGYKAIVTIQEKNSLHRVYSSYCYISV